MVRRPLKELLATNKACKVSYPSYSRIFTTTETLAPPTVPVFYNAVKYVDVNVIYVSFICRSDKNVIKITSSVAGTVF